MGFLIVLAILALVVLFVSAPLNRARAAERGGCSPVAAPGGSEREELEAAREAKLHEIRDAELDHWTGKLSDADYTAIDTTLRAEAIELLRAADALEPAPDGDDAKRRV